MAINTVGQARIELVPDLTGFRRETARKVRAMDRVEAQVRLVPDLTGFRTSTAKETREAVADLEVAVKVVPDVRGFRRHLKDSLAAGPTPTVDVDVQADTTQFTREMRRVTAKSPPVKVGVDVDSAAATTKIAAISRPRTTTLNVDADTGMATAQVGILAAATGMVTGGAMAAGVALRQMGVSAIAGGAMGVIGLAPMAALIGLIVGLVGLAAGAIGVLGIGLIGLGVAAVPALGAIAIGFEGIKNAAGEAKAGFDALKSSMTTVLEETMRPGFAALGSLLQEIIPQAQNVGRAFGDVFTSISTLLRDDLMGELRTMMDGMATFFRTSLPGLETMIVGFMNLGAVFGQFAGPIGAGFGQMLAELGLVFTRLESMGVLQNIMAGFGPVLAATGKLVGQLVEGLALAGNVLLPVLAPLLSALGDAMIPLGEALGVIGASFGIVLMALLPILTPLSQLLAQIAPVLASALLPVADALVGIVTMLAPILAQYVTVLAPVLSAVLLMVGDVLVALMPVVQVVIDLMVQMAPIFVQMVGHIANLLTMIAPVLGSLISAIAPVVPVLAQALLDVVEALMPLMPQLAQLALDLMPVLGFVIQNVVVPAIRFLAWFIIPFLVLAAEGIISVIGRVVGILVTVKDWLVRAGRAILDFGLYIGQMSRDVRVKGEQVLQWFQDLPGKIRGWLSGAGEWLVDTGRSLIDGLVSGIKSAGGAVKDAILGLVPDAIEGPIKKALGIQSPSRLMMEVGGYVGQGLAVGLETTVPDVQAKSELLANAATPGVEPTAVSSPVPQIDATAAVAPAGPVDATAMAEAVEAALGGVAAPAWESYGQTVQSVQTGLLTPAASSAAAAAVSMATTMAGAAGQASGAFVGMSGTTRGSLAAVNASTVNTGSTVAGVVNGTINPAWSRAGSHILAVQTGPMETAFRETRNSVQYTANTFGPAADNISVQWGRLREGTAAPVRWSIQNVFNDGVVGSWNSVSELLGTKKMGAYPIRFATGGVLPGYTPGRDVHRFVSPTGGGLELSGGEAIMRPEWTAAVGGPRAVESMNAAARSGRLSDLRVDYRHPSTDKDRFSGGGIFPVQSFAGGGIVESLAWVMQNKFPMLKLTSGLRFTDNGYHSRGAAGDFSNGYDSTPEMRAAAQWIFQNYRRQTVELIHAPSPFNIGSGRHVGDGYGFYGAGTMSQHRNHVHWAANSPVTLEGSGPVPEGFVAGGAPVMSMGQMVAEQTAPIWKKVADKVAATNFPGMTQPIPKGYLDSFKGAADKKTEELANAMSTFADPGGGGVERWRPLVETLLKRYGHSLSNTDLTLRRMNQESGGNPRAINNWDINAKNGVPSKGLMQVIDPTFAAHRDPALSPDIWDPMANVAASMRYAMSRYGSLASAYNRPGGYDAGGWLDPGISTIYNGFTKPEAILSPAESERFVNIADAFLDANMAGGSFVGQHVETQYVVDPDEIQAKSRRGVRRAMKEAGIRG